MAFASLPAIAMTTGIPSVIDGDTIEIHGERVRLHGIDAPESRQLCTRGGKSVRCGQVAARALDVLIGSRPVSCSPKDRDRYGRTVAVCHVGGVDLNDWMVRRGHAVAYSRYTKAYVAAEAEARHAKRGVWAGSFEKPEDWRRQQRQPKKASSPPQAAPDPRCLVKGNISAAGKHIYHRPGQRDYDRTRIDERRGERWFCSELEARRAGWQPAGGGKAD